jgi:hypothetical protein
LRYLSHVKVRRLSAESSRQAALPRSKNRQRRATDWLLVPSRVVVHATALISPLAIANDRRFLDPRSGLRLHPSRIIGPGHKQPIIHPTDRHCPPSHIAFQQPHRVRMIGSTFVHPLTVGSEQASGCLIFTYRTP